MFKNSMEGKRTKGKFTDFTILVEDPFEVDPKEKKTSRFWALYSVVSRSRQNQFDEELITWKGL